MRARVKIITVFFVTCAGLAQAATITVGPGAGYDFTAIQGAINAADEGDIVSVDTGTYHESITFNGTNIILTSIEPNDPQVVEGTIIQAPYDHRVVTFSGSEDASCVLRGFTITNGDADEYGGGGIGGRGTKATIKNCNIQGNCTDLGGGGLYDCDGLIEGCLIVGNIVRADDSTIARGGGLYECNGSIVNCIIMNNGAGDFRDVGYGGGLYSCNGKISGCTIINNSAIGRGGGLCDCHAQITNCTISSNFSYGNGGGLYNCNGSISDCTITGNKAEHETVQTRGGGLYHCSGTISNCIISSNSAKEFGGGLYGCSGRISYCLITTNNVTDWDGGGLSNCGAVSNCVIANNSAGGAGGGLDRCHSISNSIISGNMAGVNGGALHDCTEVINCTICGNKANGSGGAIYYHGDGAMVSNSILWYNQATNGKPDLCGYLRYLRS